ncbi:uncharacterized protein [Acropora muricata]|uniref:uncharacterized protein n=1 Tax=Acropora muricata TaxID=159855 RepID=UPI0034E529A4
MATGSEYTEDQLNYYRICCITTDELTDALRTIFKQEWDTRYATTLGEWKDEAKNGQDFKNGKSPRNQARNQELLATMINGNRAEWDCTMLFYAILFSDCIGRGLNAVVRSNVDDLRKFRNQDFAHLPRGHISKSKFQSAIAKVQGVFQALGLPIAKIQEIRNQGNFPTSYLKKVLKEVDRLKQELKVLEDQLQSEKTPFCILPPKPSHEVAARNDEVANITEVLKQLKETNESRLSYFYISGNPGSGKSQLAGLVAEQIFMESTHAFVMTLNAVNLDRLLDSYVSFSRHLKCSEYAVTNTLNDKDLKTEDKIAYIKSLAGTKVELYASWLLLVDNVVSIPEMNAHLPDAGNSHWSRGQLLITSQDTTSIPSDNSFIKQMSVSKGMAPSDATSLLATISGIADDETAKKVAHALDYQPLALASAATFVKQLCDNKPSSNVGWRDFLKKLDEGQLQNTETFFSNTNASYPYSMTTAIALAVEKSMSSDRVLKHGFNVISLSAPQPLNLDIVTNYVQKAAENSDMNTEGEFKDKDVIGLRIRKSSLLLLEEDNGEIYIRIHLVVRHVIQRLIKQHWETQRFQVVHVFILSLNQFIVDRKTEDYTANGFRLLVPHLRLLSKQVQACFKKNDLFEAIKNKICNLKHYLSYLIAFGRICFVHFDLKAAKCFASLALKLVCHDSMLDHAYASGAHSLMGKVNLRMGAFEEGKRHFERSLALRLEFLGSQHPDVATSYNDLATVLRKQGDLKQAKEYHERALAVRQQALGPQHPNVANSYNDLAIVLGDQGDLKQAKEYHERALAIRQQTLGPQHPDLATSYNNLATVLRDQGDLKKAKEYDERALAIGQQTLGPQHPDVATAYNNLATVLGDQGHLKKAKDYHERALAIRQQTLGPQHPDVATSYNNLATVLGDQGDLKKAKEYHERALSVRQQTLGPQHPDVATSYNNLATVLGDQGDLKIAKKYHERALGIRQQTLGPQHPDVATSYNNLANVICDEGDLKKAKEYHERVLAIRQQTLGPQHPDVATSYNNLAIVLGDQGDLKKAKEYYERALAIKHQTLGPQHPDVARSYNNLATVLGGQGDLKKAKKYHERALAIWKQILGPQHPDVANSYNNLATVLGDQGDLKKAKEYHERALAIGQQTLRALTIRQQTLGPQHPDVATPCNNLGTVLGDQGDLKKAKEYHERAFAIRQQTLGPQHPDVASSYNNLAYVLRVQGDLKKAKEYHERALAIRHRTLGPQHPDVATSYNNLANVLCDEGDLKKAKEYRERALVIRQQTLGPQHPDVATSYNNLATVLGDQGDLKKAKEYHERALAIRQQTLGSQHPDVATSCNNLASVLGDQGDLKKAKEYHERALFIREQTLELQHHDVATRYNNLGNVVRKQGGLKQAKEYHERALAIKQQALGNQHPDVATSYNNLANAAGDQGDLEKA